jgi:hypothetical protein
LSWKGKMKGIWDFGAKGLFYTRVSMGFWWKSETCQEFSFKKVRPTEI